MGHTIRCNSTTAGPTVEQSVSEAPTINQLIARATDDTLKIGNAYASFGPLTISFHGAYPCSILHPGFFSL